MCNDVTYACVIAGVNAARDVELLEERRVEWEMLAKKDDEEFKDTVEMAEATGEGTELDWNHHLLRATAGLVGRLEGEIDCVMAGLESWHSRD
jgi:hypothetical protein